MPREKRKPARPAEQSAGWAIVVRLADGSGAYYYRDPEQRDSRGRPLERWGWESQATPFFAEDEARRRAESFQTNAHAKEYLVVRLRSTVPRGRPASSTDQRV